MRRVESTQVPAETRRMLRERLARFLPAHSTQRGGLDFVVRPPVSDKELVDLLLNLDFLPGDDIGRARALYEEAAQRQSLTWTEPPPEPVATPPAIEENHHGAPDGNNSAAPASDAPSVQITVSVQVIPDSPSFDGLFPPPSFDELLARGWIRQTWGRFSVSYDLGWASRRQPQAAEAAVRFIIQHPSHGLLITHFMSLRS